MSAPAPEEEDRAPLIALVSMPWMLVDTPSIQLGMLQAALGEQRIAARAHSLHLAFLDFAWRRAARGSAALTVAEYEAVSTRWSNLGVPEWLFAVPPYGPRARIAPGRFAATLRRAGMPAALLAKLRALRALVPAFLESCADEVLAARPALVGFTLVYSQTVPSVALARALKHRVPGMQIVFGGPSCEGPMGPALLRAYPEVDFVVRGEGEGVLPALIEGFASGDREAVRGLPGLCSRDGAEIVATPPSPSQRVPIAELPAPIYGEYFERLEQSRVAGSILPRIPYQSARGCWWGMKSHCTFCGLNGTDMEFRSRPPERVHDDLLALARAHGVADFTIVDNIMDVHYLSTLIPRLSAEPQDLNLFCETKANLSEEQVRRLGAAGVRTIQPGIESLSTPVLKQMGKGVTALQNLRLLKRCAEQGMHVIWNLLYGFPGEAPDEYRRMAELVPALVHLTPPNLSPLMLVRFSPYHDAPERYGLIQGAPLPLYEQFYGIDGETARDLASVFAHAYDDGRDPESYVGELRVRVAGWLRDAERNRGALTYRRGPGFVTISDARTSIGSPARYQLDELEAFVYLACDAGATPAAIRTRLLDETGRDVPEARISDVLDGFVAARIACAVDGRFLALALRASAAWNKPETTASTPERAHLRATAPAQVA